MNLAIFLKAPVPGKVKTRLCPPLTPQEAAGLYGAFLQDFLRTAARTAARRIWLYYEGAPPEDYLDEELLLSLDIPPGRLTASPQAPGDLGARLAAAMADAQTWRALPLLVVGSDHPDLPLLHINHAMVALVGRDLVLGEAADGGAWCIGLGKRCDELFEEIPWSVAHTRQALVERADSLGLRHRTMTLWYDVDDLDDLRALWQRLEDGRSSAPHTHAWLTHWPQRHLLDKA